MVVVSTLISRIISLIVNLRKRALQGMWESIEVQVLLGRDRVGAGGGVNWVLYYIISDQ